MDKYQNLTSCGKQKYIEALESIKWFDTFQKDKEKILKHLEKIEDESYWVFALSSVSFDAEGFEEFEDYTLFIEELKRFPACKNLIYSVQEEVDTIKIVLTGKSSYTYYVDTEELFGWFDIELINFMNTCVFPKEGIKERLFQIPPCDQTMNYILLPKVTYEKAVEIGIIPSDMDYYFEV